MLYVKAPWFRCEDCAGGEITANHRLPRVIDQTTFHNHPVAPMNDAPLRQNIHIIDSDAPRAGVGELGVPTFVATFCDLIYAAAGSKIRHHLLPNIR
jgi:isoquinoline 1-oxidoreductase beta subunit